MKTATASLLDEALPRYDFRSRHNRLIAAPPAAVWAALERYEPSRDASGFTRLLFIVRGLGAPRGTLREAAARAGFTVLSERSEEEVVLGTTGRFWALRELANMEAPADLEAFRAFVRPGWAKAAMTIRIEPRDAGWSKLVTETRVQCVDDEARRRFARYWALINAFSGWIRRDMLRSIARIAESER